MNKAEAISKIRSGSSLKEVLEFKDDDEVVKEALKVDWKNIKFASERLRSDKAIALSAVSSSENALKQLPEAMQNNPDVLIKAFNVSHKITLVKQDLLSDLHYLTGVLRVGSSEHKIIEMLSDDTLQKYASDIYPFIKKALSKINYTYSDGFTVRALMYQIPFAKGMELAKLKVEYDSRMKDDIAILNSEQLYSLLVINRFEYLDKQKIINRTVQVDSLLSVEFMINQNLLDNNDQKKMIELASKNNSARINAFLLMKNKNTSLSDPKTDLIFHLSSDDVSFRDEGFRYLLSHLYDYENDLEVIETFLKANPNDEDIQLVLSSIGENLSSNVQFIDKLIKRNFEYFKFASASLKVDEEYIKSVVNHNIYSDNYLILEYVSTELRNNDKYMLELIKENPKAFQFASASVRSDYDVINIVLDKNEKMYKYLSTEFQFNQEIYMKVLNLNGDMYSELPYELRASKDIYLLALRNCRKYENLLQYASDEICDNEECVKISLDFFSSSIKFASSRLRNNKELVLKALNINRKKNGIEFISRKEKEEYLNEYFNSDFYDNTNEWNYEWYSYLQYEEGDLLEYASDELRSDLDFMVPFIKENPFLYRFALGEVRDNESIVNEVIKEEPFCIRYVPNEYISNLNQKDKKYYDQFLDLKITHVTQTLGFDKYEDYQVIDNNNIPVLAKKIVMNPKLFSSLPDDLKKDKVLIDEMLNIDPFIVNYLWGLSESTYLRAIELDAAVADDLYKSMKHKEDFMIKAIHKNPVAMMYTLKTMSKKRKFVLEAVSKSGLALRYVEEKFKSDQDIVFAALRDKPESFAYISPELLKMKDIAEVVYNAIKKNNLFDFENSKIDCKVPYEYSVGDIDKPNNYGKKWKSEDLDFLKNEYLKGSQLCEIATKLGRDILGSFLKLKELVDLNNSQIMEIHYMYDRQRNLHILKETLNL